jgi:hypothetical protein
MTICKYVCKNCGKAFYTDNLKENPECLCSLFGSNVKWLWLTDKPTRKELNEAYSNGYYKNQRREAMKFNQEILGGLNR